MSLKQAAMVREDCQASLKIAQQTLAPLRNSSVFIIGGTGFVGTWLAEAIACLNDEHAFNIQVTLAAREVDQFGTVAAHLATRSDIRLVRADVRYLSEFPAETNWVINAAGSPDNRVHTSDPLRTANTIVAGTGAALEAATRLPELRGFLQLSSGLVNGASPAPVREEDFFGQDCLRFNSLYTESKRMCEALCTAFVNQHRMRVVVARPFAFMGPYQLLDRPWAINNFLRDAIHGGPIRILGDADTVRSYMYPSDMAASALAILVLGRSGQAYNLGSSEQTTLGNAARLVASKFNPNLTVVRPTIATKAGALSTFMPHIEKVDGLIGFNALFKLDDAITRTVEWQMLDKWDRKGR